MIINRGKYSTYYAPVNCYKCDKVTNYGEAIAVNIPEVIVTGLDDSGVKLKAIPHFIRVCPRCYIKAVNKVLSAQNMKLNCMEEV